MALQDFDALEAALSRRYGEKRTRRVVGEEPIDVQGQFSKPAPNAAAYGYGETPESTLDIVGTDRGTPTSVANTSGIDAASSGLMASGNPYALAAGLGLQVLSSQQKAAQGQENLKHTSELARKREIRDSIGQVIKTMQRRMV